MAWLEPVVASWAAGDWGQILSALFTAVAALAAWASVFRVEHDRRLGTIPDLHVEVLLDVDAQEVRLTVVNHGGPAREVKVMGVIGDFGVYGLFPPSSYWQAGERRTVKVSMPPLRV